jgi:hypothetical protein
MLWFACSPQARPSPQSLLARLFCRSTSKHREVLAKVHGSSERKFAAPFAFYWLSSLAFVFFPGLPILGVDDRRWHPSQRQSQRENSS